MANSHPPICPCLIPLAGLGGDFSFLESFSLFLLVLVIERLNSRTRRRTRMSGRRGLQELLLGPAI
jgi:hypothetical protein